MTTQHPADADEDVVLVDESAGGDIKKFVAAKTGLHPTAFAVKIVPALPKSSAGKTLYAQLETSLG